MRDNKTIKKLVTINKYGIFLWWNARDLFQARVRIEYHHDGLWTLKDSHWGAKPNKGFISDRFTAWLMMCTLNLSRKTVFELHEIDLGEYMITPYRSELF